VIPSVSRVDLLEAMEEFDKELRGTQVWSNWERKGTYKYAIVHDGQRALNSIGLGICGKTHTFGKRRTSGPTSTSLLGMIGLCA
jgi:hypothetical protein